MRFIVCAEVYRNNRVIFDHELQADSVGHVHHHNADEDHSRNRPERAPGNAAGCVERTPTAGSDHEEIATYLKQEARYAWTFSPT